MTRRALAARLLAVLSLLAVALVARPAAADVERYALLVGNDRGDAQDGPLKYAGADAERMRDVLTQMGGFAPADVVVVRDDSADRVRSALIALNDRIRSATARPGVQAMLLVYYSGHADADALHLGASRLDLRELEQLVRGSSAQFRLLLVDACRSGALTRTKGGRSAPPFSVRVGERLDGQGVVFLTSSSANEDSQESDELRGSFFTHFFVSGLLGAADADGDGRVDLDEAYHYAYESTLRATSRTFAGTQHPTFRFELGGQGKVPLTEPAAGSTRSALVFPGDGAYLVFRDSPNGAVVGEVTATAAARRLAVKPGRYFVRMRAADHLLEGNVDVAEGESHEVASGALHRVEYARLVRKGGSDLREVHGPVAGWTMRTALRNGVRVCNGAYAGYAFTFTALTVTPRLDACASTFDRAVHATANEYGGDVRFAHAWDIPVVTVDIALSLGASWLRQTFETTGVAPARDTIAFRSSVGIGLTVDVPAGFYALADGAAESYVFRLEDTTTGTTAYEPSLALRVHAGIGKHW